MEISPTDAFWINTGCINLLEIIEQFRRKGPIKIPRSGDQITPKASKKATAAFVFLLWLMLSLRAC